jgi:hypothetical protein
VQPLADALLEPLNNIPKTYVAIRFGDFVEGVYLPFIESKRKPSTVRGYRQMWLRYLKPRSADWVMHDVETRAIQVVLDRSNVRKT